MDEENNASWGSDSPAKSSSACSSPLPFLALSPIPTSSGPSKRYSLEEVWRDISLSSFHHPSKGRTGISATTFSHALQDSSVQDFLSRPPPSEKQRTRTSYSTGQGGQLSQPIKESGDNGFIAYETCRVAPILSLSTRTEIHFHEHSSVEPQLHTSHESHDAFGSRAADSLRCPRLNALNHSSPVEFSILCKKRIPESDGSTSDDRSKRLMKNRESADRSRARKQAYTTELELEVSRLVEENGRLRRQLAKLCTAATPAQYPGKHTLQRTLTAPF